MPDLKLVAKGKVRDIYEIPGEEDKLLFVATDRISAFDVIMENVRTPSVLSDSAHTRRESRIKASLSLHCLYFGFTNYRISSLITSWFLPYKAPHLLYSKIRKPRGTSFLGRWTNTETSSKDGL